MRIWLIGLAVAVAAESAALACSCVAPGTPEQSRAAAREAVRGAAAIVDADILTEYRPGQRAGGERVRVRRVLWGKAPRAFRIERGPHASGAACDHLFAAGERRILLLRPAPGGWLGERRFTVQNLCSDYLFNDRRFLKVTLEEARRR